jgi:hypothetical protein
VELIIYQYYARDVILAYFGGVDAGQTFCHGEFVVFPQATVCLFTVRTSVAPSHFTAPSYFTWRPQGQPKVDDHSFPWLPAPARTTHRHVMFVRTDPAQDYLYVGTAHLGSYGRAGQDLCANYSLDTKLPRHAWLAVGGSLVPSDPFLHLRTSSAPIAPLSYHQHVFDLLHLAPRFSEHTAQLLRKLEYQYNLSLPISVHEWYSLVGAMDIMHEISLIHEPANIPDELLDPDAEQARMDLLQAYQATPPYLQMLPLIYENQWCWNIVFPSGKSDNPHVYQGERLDPPGQHYQFEWHLHTERFSDFLWAWVWDYVTDARDYAVSLPIYGAGNDVQRTPYLTLKDLTTINRLFRKGPVTFQGNGYFRFDRCERYFFGDQRIAIIFLKGVPTSITLSAETPESLRMLLQGPWSVGNLMEQLPTIDLEMQAFWLP